jgi:tripartite-type tricarboxylate transporter receptor subunit TctC
VQVVNHLSSEIGAILRVRTWRKPSMIAASTSGTPAEFRAFIESETRRWLKVAQGAGIRPE